MASGFSSKYGGRSSSSSKPDCFGDEEYYDPIDQHCRQCSSKYACKLKIERRQQNTRGTTAVQNKRRLNKKAIATGRQDMDRYEEVDPEESDTFASTLIHNASLNAIQASLDTASHAWAQIPRKGYHNIFHSARQRRKKKE